MIKKETVTHEISKAICDEPGCGAPRNMYGPQKCYVCDKDLCRDHYKIWVDDPSEPGESYGNVYCQRCLDVGEPMRKAIIEEYERHDAVVEALRAEWFRACKSDGQNDE